MLAACLIWSGCKDDMMEENGTFKEGTVTLQFAVQGSQEVETRADGESDGDSRLDNALVFAFDEKGNCVAKQWTYLDGSNTMSMYLSSSVKTLCAVCNLLDPETVMNKVSKRADLDAQAVTISESDGAYKGKYVMSGELKTLSGNSYTIYLTRLAAQFNVTVKFVPSVASDKFMLSEISLHNIPRGSWLFQQNQGTVDEFTREEAKGELGPVATADGGQKGDYVYNESAADMQNRFFEKEILDWEDKVYAEGETKETNEYAVETTFNIFENRRGTLDKDATTEINGETKSINWPDLSGENNMTEYAQLFKRQLAKNAGFTYATYMAIKGVYRMAGGTDYETTYYIYLGNDNYSDYNVNRNTKYDLTVTIRTVEQADTRVEPVTLGDMKVYYNESEWLDTHFNAVQTLVYSPRKWEMWVENPDENPWLELSTEKKYSPQLGDSNDGSKAGTRLIGTAGMTYIYVHTDEYVPVIASPQQNAASVRQARIGYRWQHENGTFSETKYFTVKQYPAQMVVLHIKYDVHTMKEVRDTFYVERVLEKKNLKWGFEHYWSFVTDDLIASGMWDGLSNTRKLYDVALNGDKWGVEPAYPDGVIPSDVALSNVIEKNRDRNGNGKIDYNEIVWYMPAVYELQALQEALAAQNVTFEGGDDFFFSSTPSSADPAGITTGFAWYVKMQNGKSALAQRDRQYNVIALRRKNAWKGPETAGGNGSVHKNDEWDEEEVIMPKY